MSRPSPYRTAAKIAWRETRASSGRFFFVILAVAAAWLPHRRTRFLARVPHYVAARCPYLHGGRPLRPHLPAPHNQANGRNEPSGAAWYPAHTGHETLTMASPPMTPRAPDLSQSRRPRHLPLLRTVKFDPPMDVRTALRPYTVAVDDAVLLRLAPVWATPFASVANLPHQRAGRHGTRSHDRQPQRGSACHDVARGPRAHRSAYPAAAPPSASFSKFPGNPIQTVHNELHNVFRNALIADYSEAHPLIEQGLRQSTTFLSLVSLIALVIARSAWLPPFRPTSSRRWIQSRS